MVEQATIQRSFQEQLEIMRRSYAARLPAKIEQIAESWRSLKPREQGTDVASSLSAANAEMAHSLYRMAHSLVGSGRTFGMPAITDAARALENLIESVTKSQAPPSAAQDAQFEALLELLRRVAASSSQNSLLQPIQNYVPSELQNEFLTISEATTWPQDTNQLILLRGDGPHEASAEPAAGGLPEASGLVAQLEFFGYKVKIYDWVDVRSSRQLQAAFEQSLPVAVLMQGTIGQFEATAAALNSLQTGRDTPLPLIFLSNNDELDTRLRAVRAGCDEFLTIPVDVSSLTGKLQSLAMRQSTASFHVLIVESEPALSNLYAFILQQAGMTTSIASDPCRIVPALHEASPDLILMDTQLPGCTGLELARAIRQMDAFAGVPIIFLSAEAGLQQQMVAMHLGGDLFLPKPVQPEHLVAASIAAAQRSRVLRAFMVRDSLTGLFNHTHTRAQLDIELARALRTGAPISLALLDLDDFQRINEAHSHAQGDRVLKSITRLLRQLVRKTDTVGRYDGDSFVVILPEAAGAAAERVLERIRDHFENVCHRTGSAEFCMTFSCGISTLEQTPQNSTDSQLADELVRRARQALLEAKNAGRNRITVVNSTVLQAA